MTNYIDNKTALRNYVTDCCGYNAADADIDAGVALYRNHPDFFYGCDISKIDISDDEFFSAVYHD